MMQLRIPAPIYESVSKALLADAPREACAILFTQAAENGRYVVSSFQVAPDDAYDSRDDYSAVLKAAYLVQVANRARLNGAGVVLCHTHPSAAEIPAFSPIDGEGEVELAEYFGRRAAHAQHFALVIGRAGCSARVLGTQQDLPVWEVGREVRLLSKTTNASIAAQFDRQARAFGGDGQSIVQDMRVGIVGLGGTGSVIAQQLAYLGVRDFVVVDPDRIEQTNLNRVVTATANDIGEKKSHVAKQAIQRIQPGAVVRDIQGDVVNAEVAGQLLDRDFIFSCTDTHASRAVLAQLAYQYLIPTIDMGVSITVKNGEVTHIAGRTQMLAPQLPCLICTQALDSEQIRREFLTPEQRNADPYVQGAHEPQPAVISLNTSMAGLAITMFLGAVTSIPANARFQLYDGIRGTVRVTTATSDPNCIVCSSDGAVAKGSSTTLPTRELGS